jgi:hypothetical protein
VVYDGALTGMPGEQLKTCGFVGIRDGEECRACRAVRQPLYAARMRFRKIG